MFVNYYEKIYATQGSVGVDECLSNIDHRVSEAMNDWLLRVFTEDEVRAAIFQMYPLNSPELDGYSAMFFHKHWDIVGKEVSDAILGYLNGGRFVQPLT